MPVASTLATLIRLVGLSTTTPSALASTEKLAVTVTLLPSMTTALRPMLPSGFFTGPMRTRLQGVADEVSVAARYQPPTYCGRAPDSVKLLTVSEPTRVSVWFPLPSTPDRQ